MTARPDIHDPLGWAVYLAEIITGKPTPVIHKIDQPDQIATAMAETEAVFTPGVVAASVEITSLLEVWAAERLIDEQRRLRAALEARDAWHSRPEARLGKLLTK